MGNIFKNQKLTVTLTARDGSGNIIKLTGRTVHFLTYSPSGLSSTITNPTIADPTNGQVSYVHVAGTLNEAGYWIDKLLIDTDEVPSTRYRFKVFNLWEK